MEQITLTHIYDIVSNNITNVKTTYDHILDPNINNLTNYFISIGHDDETAYIMSFSCLLITMLQINDVKVDI